MKHKNIGGSFDNFLREKGIMEDVAKVAEMEEEYDRCVGVKEDGAVCNVITPYRKTDHVDGRGCYVEGAGQLCFDCWRRIYGGL